MEKFKIAIAEDDKWYAEMLKYSLSLNPDYEVFVFNTGKSLLNKLKEIEPAVVTVDFSLPDMNGDEILKKIKIINPEIEVVVVSGQEDVTTAIDLLKQGAYDYLVKNEEVRDRIWNTVLNIKENIGLKEEVKQLRTVVGKTNEIKSLIKGNSKAIIKVHNLINKSLETNINVSITGETGTGKELVAKAVHFNSSKAKKPFVAINVAAIPSELIESELFGHEKGAFTGASEKRIGKFEEAGDGTLFLDEIGEMDLNMQSKLLRVLQEKEIVRVGSNKIIKINCRIITATHRDLKKEVSSGKFRQDLYFRIMGLPIQIPALRDRQGDVLFLAQFFISEFCKENKIAKKAFTEEAKLKLQRYSFPGNVRELKSVMELAIVLSDETIDVNDLNFEEHEGFGELMNKEMTLREYNLKIVKHYIEKCNGKIIQAAKKLDVGKSTIYRMLQEETDNTNEL